MADRIFVGFMIRNKIALNPEKSKADLLKGYPVCVVDENDCVGTLEDAVNGTTSKEFLCVEFKYSDKAKIIGYLTPDKKSRSYMVPMNTLSNESGISVADIENNQLSKGLVDGKDWPEPVWEKVV